MMQMVRGFINFIKANPTNREQFKSNKIATRKEVCQMYEEEQIRKVREGRKAVPSNKMPDLGWDIADTQLQKDSGQVEVQGSVEINAPQTALPLQAMITIAILLITVLRLLNSYTQEIPKITKKITQIAKSTVIRINKTKVIRNARKIYRETGQKIMTAKRAIDHTNRKNHHS